MIVNSLSLAFILPKAKREKTRKLCFQALTKNRIKLRDLAKVMGNFSWAIPAVPFAQVHYRKVQSDLIWMLGKMGAILKSTYLYRKKRGPISAGWVRNIYTHQKERYFQRRYFSR